MDPADFPTAGIITLGKWASYNRPTGKDILEMDEPINAPDTRWKDPYPPVVKCPGYMMSSLFQKCTYLDPC